MFACQGYNFILNAVKPSSKTAGFITVSLLGVFNFLLIGVSVTICLAEWNLYCIVMSLGYAICWEVYLIMKGLANFEWGKWHEPVTEIPGKILT